MLISPPSDYEAAVQFERTLRSWLADEGTEDLIVLPAQLGDRVAATAQTASLILATSGSTADDPGLVRLPRHALRAATKASAQALGGTGDWVLALPLRHIAGIMVLIRAAVAGRRTIIPASWPHLSVEDLALCVPKANHDTRTPIFTSLVSAQLADALAAPSRVIGALAQFDAILVGGGRIDPGLLDEARARGLRVTTTYGMTETAGGCVYDGFPIPGTELRIEPETGRVLISTDSMMAGYLNKQADFQEIAGRKYLRTADVGELNEVGRLSIYGRVDDIVNSGGVKVALPDITAALLSDERVEDAACIAIDDPRWGQLVAALVVPGATPAPMSKTAATGNTAGISGLPASTVRAVESPLPQALHETVRAALGSPHAPRVIVFADSLPRTELGKVRRAAIAEQIAEAIRQGGAWQR